MKLAPVLLFFMLIAAARAEDICSYNFDRSQAVFFATDRQLKNISQTMLPKDKWPLDVNKVTKNAISRYRKENPATGVCFISELRSGISALPPRPQYAYYLVRVTGYSSGKHAGRTDTFYCLIANDVFLDARIVKK